MIFSPSAFAPVLKGVIPCVCVVCFGPPAWSLSNQYRSPHTRSSQYLCIILYDDSCSSSIQLSHATRFRCDFSSALPASVHLITDPSLRTVPKFVTFSVDSQSSGSPSEVSVMHKETCRALDTGHMQLYQDPSPGRSLSSTLKRDCIFCSRGSSI